MQRRLKLILGGPGAGKTTHLLNVAEEEMAGGVLPSGLSFVTFTKAAANEAAERAANKFKLDAKTDLPWFRTIHSLAYQRLNMSRDEVIDSRDLRNFGELIGERISGINDTDAPIPTGSDGDKMMRVVDFAATCMITLDQAWHMLDEPVDWWKLKRFDDAYANFKQDMGKIDFTDMLLHYVREGDPIDVEVAVVDEGQDLTAAQWAVVNHAFSKAKRIYIGGDDDQAIYRWAGADVNHFLNLSTCPEVLPVSHRLPEAVFRVAQEVASRISRRYDKPYKHTDKAGQVHWYTQPEGIDLAEGSWLLLARNRHTLGRLEAMARDIGVNYSTRSTNAVRKGDVELISLWQRVQQEPDNPVTAKELRSLCKAIGITAPQLKELDKYVARDYLGRAVSWPWEDALVDIPIDRRNYYLACQTRGEDITTTPRIRIETIHGVKGAEADHVLLMTDMTSRTKRSYELDPDSEHRVFYVGVTRARNSLHIVGQSGYPL